MPANPFFGNPGREDPMPNRPLNILMICDYQRYGSNANTLLDHINAFSFYSSHNVFILSNLGEIPPGVDLDAFDAVVIHYSIVTILDAYLGPETRERIARFKGLKAYFIQDEYRQTFEFVGVIEQLGIDVVFTCLPKAVADVVYPSFALPKLRKEQILTGCVPRRLLDREPIPMRERPVDAFYRGRVLPYWLGSVGQEKAEIVELVKQPFADAGLACDLKYNEEDRIYGDAWIKTLQRSKVVLGVESAVSVIDFTGNIERRTRAFLLNNPGATYEQAEAECFPGCDLRYNTAQISPRCFEAAALRTGLLLFEGDYSGVLTPWRHYIPLAKDGSNLPKVVEHLKSNEFLETMTENAYREIACNPKYSYPELAACFDRVCNEEATRRETELRRTPPHELHRMLSESVNRFDSIPQSTWQDDERGRPRRIPLPTAPALSYAAERGRARVVHAVPLQTELDSEAEGGLELGVWTATIRPSHSVEVLQAGGKRVAGMLGRSVARMPKFVRRIVKRPCHLVGRFFSSIADYS
jgi:hypothetical protein